MGANVVAAARTTDEIDATAADIEGPGGEHSARFSSEQRGGRGRFGSEAVDDGNANYHTSSPR
ncbi:MAG: hypothetical protein ACQETI_12615 [Halobacteriota archaeon]